MLLWEGGREAEGKGGWGCYFESFSLCPRVCVHIIDIAMYYKWTRPQRCKVMYHVTEGVMSVYLLAGGYVRIVGSLWSGYKSKSCAGSRCTCHPIHSRFPVSLARLVLPVSPCA